MGWLGWEPGVVLATDINLVIMALGSKADLLSAIHGSGEKPGGKRKAKGKIAAGDFKAWAARHNKLRGGRDGK